MEPGSIMDSMLDELYCKLEESETARVLQHGKGQRKPNEGVVRERTLAERSDVGSWSRSQSGVDGIAGVEERDWRCDRTIPKPNTERGTGRLQNLRSRRQIQALDIENDSRDSQWRGGRGKLWARNNSSQSSICKNNFQSSNARNFHAYGNGAQGSCTFGEIGAGEEGAGSGNENERGIETGRNCRSLYTDNTSATSGQKNIRPMGYRCLKELSTQSSAEVIRVLTNSHSGFVELVQSPASPDLIILIMKILATACRYEKQKNKASILAIACHSNFVGGIRQHLYSILIDKEGHKSRTEDFIDNLLIFYESVLQLLPNTASETFEDIFKITDVVMNGVENYQKKNLTNQKEIFFKLQKQLTNMIEERNSKEQKMKSKNELLKYQRPPDDFREKSVFPTVEDIFGEAPFIRPNIVDGAYENVEQYLDIQFRLLREDFVAPLREGIKQFILQNDSKKYERENIENVRIYHKMTFGCPTVINNQVRVTIHFNSENRLMNTKQEHSERFMFGALLCFSKNNFQNIFFGTVFEKNLQKGQVTVLLYSRTEEQMMGLEGQFVMAELEIYFEPYQQVLKALQQMTEETFPMSQYIIAVKKERQPPLYLMANPHATYKIDQRNVELLDWNSWPGEEDLQLDTSQYEAFRAALTEEFVIIQGPPGTGKTFLGLKVAETLLENPSLWNAYLTPILVVCYTNHALDQFLEGLLPVTEKMLRVGGQSKSEELSIYNLKEKRKYFELIKYFDKMDSFRLDTYFELTHWFNKMNDFDEMYYATGIDYAEEMYYTREIDYFEVKYFLEKRNWFKEMEYFEKIQFFKKLEYFKKRRCIKKRRDYPLPSTADTLRASLNLMFEIKTLQANFEELQKMKGVLKLKELQKENIISENHLRCFTSSLRLTDLMFEWLGEGFHEMNLNADDASNVADKDAGDDEEPADFEDNEDQIGSHHEHKFDFRDVKPTLLYSVDVQKLEIELRVLKTEIETISEKVEMTSEEHNKLLQVMEKCYLKNLELQYWKTSLQKSHRVNLNHIRILEATDNLWQLSSENRWILYKNWVNNFKKSLKNKMQQLEILYQTELNMYEKDKQALDLRIMRDSLVIGMTTTMAARLKPLLQDLKPKIVIVEEAAEVLESHIIVSLTKQCEHVILIGDHQQLRPSTSVYRLATQFHFDVSLFERLVKNGISHRRLGVQHRMHPDIAQLIVPAIYPELLNHPLVQKYPQVKGVTKSLFFVSHCVKEEEVEHTKSHQNIHEAEFLLHLCHYLLQQGYQPDEITILATYNGQMFYMKQRQKSMAALENVKITVVDNFQGEENKIILLSLVRSNDDAKIGFLKIENRVCVALSRAREGLYIVGNMNNLTESSSIWPKVKQSLEEQGCFGTELTLQCSVHPHQLTKVCTGRDFVKLVPEGGCSLPCNYLLKCDHHCQSICHVNCSHENYKCHKKCERIPPECTYGHPCTKECYLPCGECLTKVERTLPCGHIKMLPCHVDHLDSTCEVLLKVTLPHCGHLVDKPCFADIEKFSCPVACEGGLSCGHSCSRFCHPLDDPDHAEYKCIKPCAKKNAECSENHTCSKLCHEECGTCQLEITKRLPCGHEHKVKCSADPAEIRCEIKLDRTMPCGHKLKLKCFVDLADVKCHRKCEKTLSCGHKCPQKCFKNCGCCWLMVTKKIPICGHQLSVKCSEAPNHSKCRKQCERKLRCGHDCMAPCGLPCTTKCHVKISRLLACGHTMEFPCFSSTSVALPSEDLLLHSCRAPCGKVLACTHVCRGSCGECQQGRTHLPCKEKCEYPFTKFQLSGSTTP